MTQWDVTRRVVLDPPWGDFWLELYEDPAIEDWLHIEETVNEAQANPEIEVIRKACASLRPLVAKHNLTNRAGEPIEIDFDKMSVGLYRAVSLAVLREMQRTADEDPKPNREQRRRTSSRKGQPRSASPSSG